ncbi:putative cystathionine gamma-lyase 2 [Bradysia coprophila]|uniref:putative cystathionine gamma-lyase 2 n=1 Tax=Bradysia coprophila TaxID=38358 RepID=UPI00187DCBE0|nr:putative cystathionine gamma-lyase 2 [Bradysia coprophila]
MTEGRRFETRAILDGQKCGQWSNSEVIPPIVTTMTYFQEDPTDIKGYCYGRFGNPTVDVLQNCIAGMDKAKHCLVYPSGCSAATALLNLLKPGEHYMASNENYGGPRTLFEQYCKNQGIEIDFFDPTDTKSIEATIKPNTRLVWVESPSNPCLKISDIAAIAKIVHSRSNQEIIFAIDNTIMTSYFQRPLEMDADVIFYSLTKYMNGHNDVLGGALVTNDTPLYDNLKANQISTGSLLSPFDCYLVNRGLKTLSLRMTRHCENALAVATYLESHPKIRKVTHPGLPSHPQYELAKKVGSNRAGIVLAQLNGTVAEAKKFIQNLSVFVCSGSIGSFGSMILIPTYLNRSDDKTFEETFGIFDDTVRLSVGIENIDDLIEDLDQALKKAFE